MVSGDCRRKKKIDKCKITCAGMPLTLYETYKTTLVHVTLLLTL